MTSQHFPLPGAQLSRASRSFRLDRRSLVPALAFSLVLVLVLVGLWIANERAKDRAIRELPDAARQVLYDHTLSTLQTVCASRQGSNAIQRYCREQAELAVRFPECGTECRALAERQQHPFR